MTRPAHEAEVSSREGEASRLDRGLAWVKSINLALHYVAGATMVLLMFLTVTDIFRRWALRSPLTGTVELTQLAVVVLVFLGLGHAEHQRDHVSVDLITARLSRKARAPLGVLAGVVNLTVLALLAWQLFEYALRLRGGRYVTPTLGFPIYPVALVAVVGVMVFAAAVVSNLIGDARDARGRE